MAENEHLIEHLNMSMTGNLMSSDISWFRIISSEDENLATARHKHIIHELQYVYEGELPMLLGDEPLPLSAGSYVLIPAGLTHQVYHPSVRTRKLVIGFNIRSDDEYINEAYGGIDFPVRQTASPTFRELSNALRVKYSADYISTSSASVISTILHALLLEIVDEIASAIRIPAPAQTSEEYQRFNQILSFINEKVFDNISTKDVADRLNLSSRQATRIAHSMFGCTINQLIAQIRIQQICFLLTRSDSSIAEIAETAGFSTPYAFSRYFSHNTGVSPSTYRKNFEIRGGASAGSGKAPAGSGYPQP